LLTAPLRNRLLFLTAVLATFLTLPAASQAAERWTIDGKASVRNYHGDFVIGNAYANNTGPNTPTTDHIDVQATSGSWKYGFVRGPANRCGWVLGGKGRMHPSPGGSNVPNGCPAPAPRDSNANPLAPQNIFAAGSYAYGTGGGTVYPAVITACPTGAFVYGNYANGKFSNKYGQLPVGRGSTGGPGVTSGYPQFGWRYQTKDGQAVLIKDSGHDMGGRSPAFNGKGSVPVWVFVRSACIRRNPPQFGPGLRITKASWHGTKVKISGKITNATQHPLTISFGCGGKRSVKHKSEKKGVFSATLTRPARCKGKSHGTARVSYQGDGRYKPSTKTRTVKKT
jgi:hypothetical protein